MDRDKWKRIALYLLLLSTGSLVITVFMIPGEVVLEVAQIVERAYEVLMQIAGVFILWLIRLGLWALSELTAIVY